MPSRRDQGRPGRRRDGRARRPTWPSATTARIAAVGADLDAAGAPVLDAGGLHRRPRARRPPHPPARAGQGGGRDGRDRRPGRGPRRLHRRGGHAQHRARHRLAPRWCARCSSSGGGALCDVHVVRRHHRRPRGRAARARWPRWPRSACASSPTTAAACRTTAHAPGAWSTPAASASPSPSTARSRPSSDGGHMHEGEWSSPPRHPRQPGRGRGADGDPRHRPGPPHRRHASTSSTCPPPARSSWCARPRPRACRSPPRPRPHHFTLTHAEVRRLRPGVQGEPAAAHRRRRRRGQGRPGRRHHRRHRHRPRPAHPGGQGGAVRPGAPGDARPRDGARPRLTELVEPGVLDLAEVLAAAVVAARPPSPASATPTAARSPRAARQPRA